MVTKRVQFVRPIDKYDSYGNQELEFIETANAEKTLREWYGFAEHEDGFTQEIIDWFFDKPEDNILLERAKRIIEYVNTQSGVDWISLTIEQWLILEHTRWLIIAGEEDRKHCRKLEEEIRQLKTKRTNNEM